MAPSARILNWKHPFAQKGFTVLTHICPHHVCTSINKGFQHNKNNFVIDAEEYLGMYNSAPVPSVYDANVLIFFFIFLQGLEINVNRRWYWWNHAFYYMQIHGNSSKKVTRLHCTSKTKERAWILLHTEGNAFQGWKK